VILSCAFPCGIANVEWELNKFISLWTGLREENYSKMALWPWSSKKFWAGQCVGLYTQWQFYITFVSIVPLWLNLMLAANNVW